MNIISVPGLDPAYRLYQTDAGLFVRVKVTRCSEDTVQNTVSFCLLAEVCDAMAQTVSSTLTPVYLNVELAQLSAPVFSDGDGVPTTPGTPAELVRHASRLYQYDDDVASWIDRGPIDPTASETAAEYLAMWDQLAREEVIKAEAAAKRLAAADEINALISAP